MSTLLLHAWHYDYCYSGLYSETRQDAGSLRLSSPFFSLSFNA